MQKTSKFQQKQFQKHATHKSSKKPATPQKNKPKFAGNRKVSNTAASLTTAELRHMHYNIVFDT